MIHRDNLQKTVETAIRGPLKILQKERSMSSLPFKGEEFGEKVVGWVRIIYILLIVAVIGG